MQICAALKRSDVASVLGVTARKLSCYVEPAEVALPAHVASKTWTLADVLARATSLFGGVEDAQRWMVNPAIGLDGWRPIDMLKTIQGAEVVHDFLLRLEYGVYT